MNQEIESIRRRVEFDRAAYEASGEVSLIASSGDDGERQGVKQELYNRYATAYELRTQKGLPLFLQELNIFSKLLVSSKGKVVDLGCGPGRDAAYLKSKGFVPLCCDFSEQMLKLCTKKGLETRFMNYETDLLLNFDPESLDGVWTNCSFTTEPETKIRSTMRDIYSILKPEGICYFGFIESIEKSEGWIKPDFKYKLPRYRFRAPIDYISKMIVGGGFQILSLNVVPKEVSGKNTYLKYLCRKSYETSRM